MIRDGEQRDRQAPPAEDARAARKWQGQELMEQKPLEAMGTRQKRDDLHDTRQGAGGLRRRSRALADERYRLMQNPDRAIPMTREW